MASGRLEHLQETVEELRRLLLPYRFDPTGTYGHADRVRARTLSFRILVHAEIESYFEDRVVEIAKSALQSWSQGRGVSYVTMCILGFSGLALDMPPDTLQPPNDNKRKVWPDLIDVGPRFEKSVSDFVYRTTKENHGIKERNVLSMLLPIGVVESQFDQLFLTSLNSFGEDRGVVAHNSRRSYITQSVDPQTEYTRVGQIMSGIQQLDSTLDQLLALT